MYNTEKHRELKENVQMLYDMWQKL